MTIAATRLRELVDYDPNTGAFVNKVRRGPSMAGEVAGTVTHRGYRHMQVEGRLYQAHRLAWLYVYGEWPAGLLDHVDLNRDNNAIANLRGATITQNLANARCHSDSKSGLKGVDFHRCMGRWRARIRKDGVQTVLGYFATAEEAHAVYVVAARQLFGEFARAA